jgi:peroxiredoxin
MKKILIALLLQIPVLVFAQNIFTLKGEFTNLKETKNIYLIHVENGLEKLDSTKVSNRKFEFKVDLESPSLAILLLDHTGNDLTSKQGPKDFYRFFIEPGNATLNSTDSVSKAKLGGLDIFDVHEQLLKSSSSIEKQLVALNKEFSNYPEDKRRDPKFAQGFQDRYEALLEQRSNAIAGFILKNPNSYVSLYALNGDLATDDMNLNLVESAYKGLSDELKDTYLAKSVLAKLDLAKRTSVGVNATDFEANTPEQIPIKLSNFKGQYVLVDFWASWCGPCRQENPNVVRAYETFKDKNFTVLGVSIDEKEDAWVKAVKQDGLVWTQVLDKTSEIATMYGINAIPKNFLVDPTGKIIAKNLRGPELMSTLDEVLRKKK